MGRSDYIRKFCPSKAGSWQHKRGIPPCRDEIFHMSSQDIIHEEFISLPGSQQNGTEFHPGQLASCNHYLKFLLSFFPVFQSERNLKALFLHSFMWPHIFIYHSFICNFSGSDIIKQEEKKYYLIMIWNIIALSIIVLICITWVVVINCAFLNKHFTFFGFRGQCFFQGLNLELGLSFRSEITKL